MSDPVATAALALVGSPFRLHGREPTTGLDCVGVVGEALHRAGWEGDVPTGYALRGGDPARIVARLDALFDAADGVEPGAVLLVRPGAGQLHLMIRTTAGFVHADAGLRRVVERPGSPPWPMIGAWRWQGEPRWRR